MKKIIILSCTLMLLSCQKKHLATTTKLRPVASFFAENRAKVLVVGTFHFDYPGLDGHKTKNDDKIDVLTESRQAEVLELSEYIKK